MNDSASITIDGTTLRRPTDKDHARKMADRWDDAAMEWEDGSEEQIHCHTIADRLREMAR
jgi:hypothetical protein